MSFRLTAPPRRSEENSIGNRSQRSPGQVTLMPVNSHGAFARMSVLWEGRWGGGEGYNRPVTARFVNCSCTTEVVNHGSGVGAAAQYNITTGPKKRLYGVQMRCGQVRG